jgi:hypothetical protein
MIHPEDDNGDVLRRMEAQGDDLSKPRNIDFTAVFSSEDAARHFTEKIEALGYETSVRFTQVEDGFPWDVCVTRHMAPSHQAIGAFEDLLGEFAALLGGHNDGWGCFSQPILN